MMKAAPNKGFKAQNSRQK